MSLPPLTASRLSLEGVLDKEDQAEVLAAFKEAGAISESQGESSREARR